MSSHGPAAMPHTDALVDFCASEQAQAIVAVYRETFEAMLRGAERIAQFPGGDKHAAFVESLAQNLDTQCSRHIHTAAVLASGGCLAARAAIAERPTGPMPAAGWKAAP